MPRRAIVFDLGNVLIDWNIDYLYKTMIPDGQERMDGILFTTPEDLEQALASRGVLTPDG